MDEKRRGEIAYAMFKRYLKESLSLRDLSDSNARRKLGNVSKETGIPIDELLEFFELIGREVFEEQVATWKKNVTTKEKE